MPVLRRVFGFIDDATAGGKDFDTLAGTIPDSTSFWPVTGATIDGGIERIDRNAEVRGRRANTHPLPFRGAPSTTFTSGAYREIVEKALYKTMGVVNTTGVGPYTHEITSLQFGSVNLPAMHLQLVRDDLNQKMGGCTINRTTLNFPLDGEGTVECEVYGKWLKEFATAAPTLSFTGLSDDILMLRDAQMVIDGAMDPVPDLTGFSFSYTNNLQRKWYAGRNIEERTLNSQVKKLWWPTENKAQAAPEITFGLEFGNTVIDQEVANMFAQVQELVFTCAGTGTDELVITIHGGVFLGGGAESLSAREDITAPFEGGVFWDTAAAGDVTIEVTGDVAVLA